MVSKITSKDNAKVKYACSLKLEKYRKENHQFLCEGYKSLELALSEGLVDYIFTTKELTNISANQYLVDEKVLEKLAFSKNPEGIVFVANMPNKTIKNSAKKLLYLDEINDPGNMGTIIRTALAFNYDGIYVSKNCVSVYNEKVVAASKGAIFAMPILEKDIEEIKDKNIIVSTLSDDSVSLEKIDAQKEFVLVLGNEARGVSKEVIQYAKLKVNIPIQNIDSLNVGVAAGILMYKLAL